jgi:hypothetical protein
VVGAGERLFEQTGDLKSLRLTGSQTVGQGLSYLIYERVRTA